MIALKINSKNFKKSVGIAAKIIKEEGVVVCPTDTVYGLLADAASKKAVSRVFKIKERNNKKSFRFH